MGALFGKCIVNREITTHLVNICWKMNALTGNKYLIRKRIPYSEIEYITGK